MDALLKRAKFSRFAVCQTDKEAKFPREMTCHVSSVFVINNKNRFLGHTVVQAKLWYEQTAMRHNVHKNTSAILMQTGLFVTEQIEIFACFGLYFTRLLCNSVTTLFLLVCSTRAWVYFVLLLLSDRIYLL